MREPSFDDCDGFWSLVCRSRTTLILLGSTLLSSLAIGCVIGVIPETLSNRYARLYFGYDAIESCSSSLSPPLACRHGQDAAMNAAALANVGLCLFSLAFNPCLGQRSDTKGRRPLLILSLILNAVPALTFWIVQQSPSLDPVWYYLSFSLIGVVNYLGMGFAILSDVFCRDHVATSYGLLMAFYSAGLALAASIPVYLNHQQVALVSLLLSVAAVVVAAVCLPESCQVVTEDSREGLSDAGVELLASESEQDTTSVPALSCALSILVRTRPLRLLTAAAFISGLVFASDATLLIYYLKEHLGVNDTDISRLFLCLGAMGILVQGFLLRPLQGCLGQGPLLVVSFLCGTAHNLFYGLARTKSAIYVAVVLCQFTHLGLPLLSSMASQHVRPQEHGQLQAALGTVSSVSFCFGPLMSSLVYDLTKDTLFPGFMFVFCGVLYAVGTGTLLLAIVPPHSATTEVITISLHEPLLEAPSDEHPEDA